MEGKERKVLFVFGDQSIEDDSDLFDKPIHGSIDGTVLITDNTIEFVGYDHEWEGRYDEVIH